VLQYGSELKLREEEMPPIFKALATISAWVLFISAWLFALTNLVIGILTGVLFTVGAEGWAEVFAYFVLAIVCTTLSVVVMRLRQKME
jgi:hypothetical protein